MVGAVCAPDDGQMQTKKLDHHISRFWPGTSVATTADLSGLGFSDRVLTAGVRSGKLIRLRRGAYVRAQDWHRRKPWEQDLLRIEAHHRGARTTSVYSHASAARLHGCSPWDSGAQVHVTTPFSPSQGSSGDDVVAHGGPLSGTEIVEVLAPWERPIPVTSLERTVVDCARAMDFERALVIADQALRKGADPQAMRDYLSTGAITRGARRLWRILDAMDGRSESVGETRTRALLDRLGIGGADLQVEVMTPIGTYRGDFGWRDHKLILEFDGRAKYFDYAPTEDVIFQERRREKALMAMGWNVIRIEWGDLSRPWEVERLLKTALAKAGSRKPAVPLLGSNGTAG